MNLLYTVNIGDFVSRQARDSFLAACNRWNCDYAELITKRGRPHWPESATKLFGCDAFRTFEKIMFLDGDTVISEHAPNPFDFCIMPETLYAVSDWQSPNRCEAWRELAYSKPMMMIKNCLHSYGRFPTEEQFFNSGCFMFQTGLEISSMFNWSISMLPMICSKFEEQAALNLAAINGHNVNVEILPETWNHIIPKGEGPISEFYVNHYAGWAQSLLKQL